MKEGKRNLYTFLLFLIALLILLYGNHRFDTKVQTTVENAQKEIAKDNAAQVAKQKKEEEAKIKEKQRIYNKHKGEKLSYSPMGDSLTLGQGASEEGKRYTSLLSQMIERELGYDVQLNDGVVAAGRGLKDAGIPNLQKIIDEEPDFVTIEFGTNDLDSNKQNTFSTPEEFEERLQEVIDALNSELTESPKIILVTTWRSGEKSLTYDKVIEGVGEKNNIPVVNIQSVWRNRSDTFVAEGYVDYLGVTGDGLHPNDKGYQLIAEKIFEKAYETLK